MNPTHDLRLPAEQRDALWSWLITEIERYGDTVAEAPVAPRLDPAKLRAELAEFDFAGARDALAVAGFAAAGLWRHQVHTPHPRYFGLFNPAPATMGIAADMLVAAFNPQMAAWSHSPFAAEVERHVLMAMAEKFGYARASADGVFTAGGAEANHTALLCALRRTFPRFASGGVRALAGQPVLYVTAQSHHSILKAARLCGLGTEALRLVATDAHGAMDVDALEAGVRIDRAGGSIPFFVAGTAGSTGAGIIDPLAALAEAAARDGLWFHVDAAWGGAAALVPELRGLLSGIEAADSITFDAHKFLSVPMAAGMFLTRHPRILTETFRITTDYMPRDAGALEVDDPFAHSMQWSRRFIGLKVFLSLAVAGWEGYAAAIRHQAAMGRLLRSGLRAEGWEVVNETPLPVVCFRAKGIEAAAVVARIVASGKAWISTVTMPDGEAAIRACVTNFATQPEDIAALLQTLASVAPQK